MQRHDRADQTVAPRAIQARGDLVVEPQRLLLVARAGDHQAPLVDARHEGADAIGLGAQRRVGAVDVGERVAPAQHRQPDQAGDARQPDEGRGGAAVAAQPVDRPLAGGGAALQAGGAARAAPEQRRQHVAGDRQRGQHADRRGDGHLAHARERRPDQGDEPGGGGDAAHQRAHPDAVDRRVGRLVGREHAMGQQQDRVVDRDADQRRADGQRHPVHLAEQQQRRR